MKINNLAYLIFSIILLSLKLSANDFELPSYKDMNNAVKYINKDHELNHYFGDNFNIDETENKIKYFIGKFTNLDRQECFVYIPCHDESTHHAVEYSNFGVLFYKENNKWQFIKDYLDVDNFDTLDFDKDGILEILTENNWMQNGEEGHSNNVISFKNNKEMSLFLRESLNFEMQVIAPDDLNLDKQFLYGLEYVDVNNDGKIDIKETYKIGKIIKFKNENPIFKYRIKKSNYLFKNGKFVLDKKSKKQK